MSIVLTSDFTDENYIPQTLYSDLNKYIATYEEEILINLLGVELYKLFMLDLSGSPAIPATLIYQTIFNKIQKDYNESILISDGIRKILVRFIYYYYQVDKQSQRTTVGLKKIEGENSNIDSSDYNFNIEFNKAVDSAAVIQWYIEENKADYPLYNGQWFRKTNGI